MDVSFHRKEGTINSYFKLPGDKSIAHRSLIIGALAKGSYKIENFPNGLDCLSTLDSMKKLGVKTEHINDKIFINSPGFEGFNNNAGILSANNSGTTARLLSGLAAGCNIECTIDGDNSLRKRPMDRILSPLKDMGAEIECTDGFLPIEFKKGSGLNGIEYTMPVDSAQVKSCLLIAGFLSNGCTTVIEKNSTRDHTERMFKALGADINVKGKAISIKSSSIEAKDMYIPGDISSAAFLIGCALLCENTVIKVDKILLNERRRKYLDVLISMNADIEYRITDNLNGEEIGYIIARSSSLKGTIIPKEIVANIIDEIPLLSILAAFSEGKTVFDGIDELKYKESNRIKSIVENLNLIPVPIKYSQSFLEITGSDCILNKDMHIDSYNDHRIALAFAVLAVRNLGNTIINNWECTNISFPNSLNYFSEFLNINTYL